MQIPSTPGQYALPGGNKRAQQRKERRLYDGLNRRPSRPDVAPIGVHVNDTHYTVQEVPNVDGQSRSPLGASTVARLVYRAPRRPPERDPFRRNSRVKRIRP